jgi:hypothetical protein
MSESVNNGKSTTGRRIARGALYLIPGYPVVKAAASVKETVAGGLKTIADQNRQLSAERANPRVSTFKEALARRSAEALPLEAIERSCIRKKQSFFAMAIVATGFLFGSTLSGNYFGTLLGLLFVLFCLMFVVKHEHQLWQIETGMAAPDSPLGGYTQFFKSQGVFVRLLNPRMFQ